MKIDCKIYPSNLDHFFKIIFNINIFVFIFLSILNLNCKSQANEELIDQIGIKVLDSSREFSFTNKNFGQYYGESNDYYTNGWQGWTLREQRIFNDYKFVIDGDELDRNTAKTIVYPHCLFRKYKNNIEEEFFFPDSIDAVFINLKNLKGKDITFYLNGIISKDKIILSNNIVSLPINNLIKNNILFITSKNANIEEAILERNQLRLSIKPKKELTILITVDSNKNKVNEYSNNYKKYFLIKKERINKLLSKNQIKTNDKNFDKAYLWALASLDALITEQNTIGIFAGLPWFNNYWGRDTFISLHGATLVNGNYKEAKEILLSFAKEQDKNPNSIFYGRIPNRITLNETIYNTTDGTPLFVIQSYNYYKYSGDENFIKEIYPFIKTAFEGAIKNYVDEYGFLTHQDAETWMDAVGQNGPWSPRGNRANDIQALWYQQLNYTKEIALINNDSLTANRSSVIIKKLENNFSKFFLNENENLIYDRIKKNNSPDSSIRPNQFFVLNSNLINSYQIKLKVLANAMRNLVLPYGVLSLSQYDENFHPYHEYPPYYPKDEAYHNGIIWLWNTGPVVQSLCEFGLQDTAWILTNELTNQILNRGAVGTLAELMEAFLRPNEKEIKLSGTFSQAWSLAEYLRNIYQNYSGVIPDAPNKSLYLIPSLPTQLKIVEFTQRIGNDYLNINYEFDSKFYRITINGMNIKDSLNIGAAILNRANANFQIKTLIKQNDELIIEVPSFTQSIQDLKVFKNEKLMKTPRDFYIDPEKNQVFYNEIKFTVPYLNPQLKALQKANYILLDNNEIKLENKNAAIIFNQNDNERDEKYLYPTNSFFEDGILDLINFTLSEDEKNYYFELKFRNLINPLWHPEYGFQLTATAICIQNSEQKRNANVGYNSKFILTKERTFNRIIFIGGGIEIRNSEGNIIASYIPQSFDVKNPLGDMEHSRQSPLVSSTESTDGVDGQTLTESATAKRTDKKTISFSIPKKLIRTIDKKSKITILVGAQDDHGGSGIGEFRDVGITSAEWIGGGKRNLEQDNIYDVLEIP